MPRGFQAGGLDADRTPRPGALVVQQRAAREGSQSSANDASGVKILCIGRFEFS